MKIPDLINFEKTDQKIKMVLKMNSQLQWFEGHFPDFAILPAVAQIYIAKHFGALLLSDNDVLDVQNELANLDTKPKLNILALNRMKFVKAITQDEQVILDLSFNKDKQTLKFNYQDLKGNTLSQGLIKVAITNC